MSIPVIAAIIIIALIAICLLLVAMNNQQAKKKNAALFQQFNRACAEYNINCTGQELLKNGLLGLDVPQQKLLLATIDQQALKLQCIDFKRLKSCSCKRSYGQAGAENNKEQWLQSVALVFCFKDGAEPCSFNFYDHTIHHIYELSELEQKARDWEVLVTKMIRTENAQRA